MAAKSRRKKSARVPSYKLRKSMPAPAFESDTMAKQFLRSPKTFAKKLGINLEDLACPPEAHMALKRGERFAQSAKKAHLGPDERSIAKLKTLAIGHFGRDYEARFIPFGMQFREQIRFDERLGITATGTGSITWLDSDADVDG